MGESVHLASENSFELSASVYDQASSSTSLTYLQIGFRSVAALICDNGASLDLCIESLDSAALIINSGVMSFSFYLRGVLVLDSIFS